MSGWKARSTILVAVLMAAPCGPLMGQTRPVGVPAALTALQTGDFAGAETTLRAVLADEPENGRAWSLLGFSLRSQQRGDEAIEAYETAIDLPGSGPGALFNLGVMLVQGPDQDRGFELLSRLRDQGGFDMTTIDLTPGIESLRTDPRYRALFPTESDFSRPFVEPARILQEWRGEALGDQFGWIARDMGDVDGDGVHDVTTSAPTRVTDGPAAGRIYGYSGRTGALLWTVDGSAGDQLGLGIEAAGDVNADGVPDVIAGAPGNNYAIVVSGRDGAVIQRYEAREEGELFGRKVGDLGDVNGDGFDDVLIGAPQNSAAGANAGRAYVFSGADASVLLTLTGDEAGDAFGSSGGGTTSADGRTTIIVGAPNAGPGDRGATYVYHGLTTEPAFVIESDETGAQLGAMFVSAVGDVNADGIVDVYAADWAANTNGAGSGRVYVHSGADGARLYDLAGESPGDGFGIGVADAGDVDGDGHADLIIGAWQHGSAAPSGGKVYLYSGKDGTVQREITGRVMGETFGFDATGVGDVDGDGVIDYLLTSAWSAVNGGRTGRMFIISGAPGA